MIKKSLFLLLITVGIIASCLFVYLHYIRFTPVPVSDIMHNIHTSIGAEYSNLTANQTTWPAQMGSQQPLAAPGYSFNVSSQSMPSLYITMGAAVQYSSKVHARSIKAAHDVVSAQMRLAHYQIDPTHSSLPEITYHYKTTDCLELLSDAEATLTLSCYDAVQIPSVAQQLQPFVGAYNSTHPERLIRQNDIVGPVVIKSQHGTGVIEASHTPGYDIAEMVVTQNSHKKLLVFYNQNNGQWQYVTQANDEYGFACKDYQQTTAMREAFYNQICLGDHGQIRLDSSAPALQ